MENFIGIIMYVVWLYVNKTILIWLFGYNEHLIIVTAFSILCLLPGSGNIKERGYRYEWADLFDDRNPLFAKGYFRKNVSGKTICSKLKGNYYCECILLGLYAISALYRLYCIHIIYPQGKVSVLAIDWILGILFITAEFTWFFFNFYYKRYYRMAFRYIEGRTGIWEPFSNIVTHSHWHMDRDIMKHYYVSYEKMQFNLEKNCAVKNYHFCDSIFMQEEDIHTSFWVKQTEEEIKIFQIAHIDQYSEENMQLLNTAFARFWKKHINNKYPEKEISVIYLVCIDEYNTLFRKRIMNIYSVDQGKRRYRLPAFLVYSEKSLLYIPDNYSRFRGKEKYDENLRELYQLLEIKNHKREPR